MDQAQVILMTPEMLKEYAFSVIDEYEKRRAEERSNDTDQRDKVVYGIRGICSLFNVSHKTACQYKSTFLKEAITQRGRKIITNVALARKLFNDNQQKKH